MGDALLDVGHFLVDQIGLFGLVESGQGCVEYDETVSLAKRMVPSLIALPPSMRMPFGILLSGHIPLSFTICSLFSLENNIKKSVSNVQTGVFFAIWPFC